MNSVSTSLWGSHFKKVTNTILDKLLDCCQQYPNEIEQILLLGLKKIAKVLHIKKELLLVFRKMQTKKQVQFTRLYY